jgi:hypothetical protein
MFMRIAVAVLAGGLMLGCGGAESEAMTDGDVRTGDERTVTASAVQQARFEVESTGDRAAPCTPRQREMAEDHMVKNFGPYNRLIDCDYLFFGGHSFIFYTYSPTR